MPAGAGLRTETLVSGESYAQDFTDVHYVVTNAEVGKGKGNADICSTVYVHAEGMTDAEGCTIPILFEKEKLPQDDKIIKPIPCITKEVLKASLIRYRNHLQDNLDFYEWLCDPKHGRDLSVGMIAGYLLSSSYASPHTISLWLDHERESTETLRRCSVTLAKLIRGETSLDDLSDDDHDKRYYAILFKKAEQHPGGRMEWLEKHGDLVREMWRYCGAIKGEFTDARGAPELTALKPMWQAVAGRKLPGGAHYGHIAAMIEAAFDANRLAMRLFREVVKTEYKADGSPVSAADRDIHQLIRDTLARHYPGHGFTGEEGGDDPRAFAAEGDKRWLVDPVDGTKNFLRKRDEFCISIACQEYRNGAWTTTDGVVSMPASGRIYWAEKDRGAYLIERSDLEEKLKLEPAAAAPANSLEGKMIDLSITGLGVEGETDLVHSIRQGRRHLPRDRNRGGHAGDGCGEGQ